MKRIIKITIAVLLLTLLFASCSNNVSTGSLTVSVESITSKTIRPSAEAIKVYSHKIIGSYDGSIKVNKTFTGDTITLDSLVAGQWKFYVSGLNENSEEIARSETKTVEIVQNENSAITFELSYFSDGRGIMDLSIKIPSADTSVYKVVAEISPINSSELEDKTLTVYRTSSSVDGKNSVFNFHGGIATGHYRVKFTMFDESNKKIGYSLTESLHIYRDMESSFSWCWDKDYIPPVSDVEFSIESGTFLDGTELELTTVEDGATIYYTTDGTVPTSISGTKYTGPIVLDKSMKIRAIAIKEGLVDSSITEETYVVKVNAPVISLASGSFKADQTATLSSAAEDCDIYYTLDGTVPTSESEIYTSAIAITKNCQLKAIAIKDGLESSEIVDATYSFSCNAPSFNYESGEYNNELKVRLSTTTSGGSVYYTLDGTEPTSSSLKYSESNPISINATTTLKAITCKNGWTDSEVLERTYSMKCLAPSFSVSSGSYSDTQSVTITSTSDATIYYTLDGTAPTVSSYAYSVPITVDKDTTITAIATKSGYTNSEVVTADYYISPQSTGITVLDPISLDFRIGMPEGWKNGMNLLSTVEEATLFVDTTSNVSNIKWYYDGYEKEEFKGRTSITVGGSTKDIPLEFGGHVISLRVSFNDVTYTDNLYFNCVSAETDENFVFWGDLTLGGVGPGGGYLIYDVDADNDTGNADGLTSRQCGWKYIEVAPRDMKLISGVGSISATESSVSTFIFGYYRDSTNSVSYVNGSTPTAKAFNTGFDNTTALATAMQDNGYTTEDGTTTASYAAKLCNDILSHEKEGTIKDWFLPSVEEMKYIIANLPASELATFVHDKYWTSSEAETGAGYAYYVTYSTNTEAVAYKRDSYAVRPIRRF